MARAKKVVEQVETTEAGPVMLVTLVDGRILYQPGNDGLEPVNVADAWAIATAGWIAAVRESDMREIRERCDAAGIESEYKEF